jgi:hypothetical protein
MVFRQLFHPQPEGSILLQMPSHHGHRDTQNDPITRNRGTGGPSAQGGDLTGDATGQDLELGA